MLNGDGIRVTLWVSGCLVHCKGCQNQQTWDFNSGIPFDDNALQELYDALDNPYIKGLTLTGGNPLDNIPELLQICVAVKNKFPNKDIWLYSGYTYEEICASREKFKILCYTDVLVDGPYIEDQRDTSLYWRGSKNQRLIDVKETLKQGQIVQYKINK
jgi:anaerobic ribonucleoside-triphosphate reductase activating protein